MDDAMFVYTTFPDEETALSAAEELVGKRLAACVNVVPGMRSVYRYEGVLERASEVVAIVKTRAALKDEVAAAIVALHPYDAPAISFIPLAGGSRDTLAWIAGETAAS